MLTSNEFLFSVLMKIEFRQIKSKIVYPLFLKRIVNWYWYPLSGSDRHYCLFSQISISLCQISECEVFTPTMQCLLINCKTPVDLSANRITLQEHQWILRNATVSKDYEIGILMGVYEIFFKTNFKCFKELMKYMVKIILWKKISR